MLRPRPASPLSDTCLGFSCHCVILSSDPKKEHIPEDAIEFLSFYYQARPELEAFGYKLACANYLGTANKLVDILAHLIQLWAPIHVASARHRRCDSVQVSGMKVTATESDLLSPASPHAQHPCFTLSFLIPVS